MIKELVVLEREKIKNFERLLHKAKGNDTLNMFLEKSNVDPLYIDWCISGISFIIPHESLLRKISNASEGRVSFEELKYIFKGYSQPKIKSEQIWYVEISENAGVIEKPYYILDASVGGEYSGYIKVCPMVESIGNYEGNTLGLEYGTKDGIKLKNMVLLDDYIVIERKYLLSYISSLKGEYDIYRIEKNEESNIGKYIKSIFK